MYSLKLTLQRESQRLYAHWGILNVSLIIIIYRPASNEAE